MILPKLNHLFRTHYPMMIRDPNEVHRASTMLELFFDLAIVIAIASATGSLHHAFAENHIGSGLVIFSLVFFALWWAWMNFTWFASRFDTDDAPYRIAIFAQICGALVFAAGIPSVFADTDFSSGLLGFFIMRLSLISLYLRAALNLHKERIFCLVTAAGIFICLIGWFVQVIYVPKESQLISFIFMAVCELLVPYIAARWKFEKAHHHHMVERYGLLTIIVLGECLLAIANGFQYFAEYFSIDLLINCTGSLLITFCLWWLYFEGADKYSTLKTGVSFNWGYGHVMIFASTTIIGVGMAVVTDQLNGNTKKELTVASMTVATPLAAFLLSLWYIHTFPRQTGEKNSTTAATLCIDNFSLPLPTS